MIQVFAMSGLAAARAIHLQFAAKSEARAQFSPYDKPYEHV